MNQLWMPDQFDQVFGSKLAHKLDIEIGQDPRPFYTDVTAGMRAGANRAQAERY